MNNDSPLKAIVVVGLVALVCSVLVSVTTISLKPVQQRNQRVDRSRNIVALTGLVPAGQVLSDDQILDAVEQLDIRLINIATGEFDTVIDPIDFDSRATINDPDLSIAIAPIDDLARIGRRSRFATAYLVWADADLQRVILPIHGQGMWSTLYGYLALEADLNTIAAVSFYEQTETAGLGDQVQRPDWQVQWRGRQLFDTQGEFRFRVAAGTVEAGSPSARYQVDALTGATVTGDAVTRLVEYWVGPDGYEVFIDRLRRQPPIRVTTDRSSEK
jgi:Na+-transporting NADH:ubiquinone oxidoreductase subunit C